MADLKGDYAMINIPQMKFIKEEQETINRHDSIDKMWHVYSSTPKYIRQYINFATSMNIDYKVLTEWEGKPTSIELVVPESLSNNSFLKPKRKLSEAHKAALTKGRMKRQHNY